MPNSLAGNRQRSLIAITSTSSLQPVHTNAISLATNLGQILTCKTLKKVVQDIFKKTVVQNYNSFTFVEFAASHILYT